MHNPPFQNSLKVCESTSVSFVLFGRARVEGIGDGFLLQTMNTDTIDSWVQVRDEDTIVTSR